MYMLNAVWHPMLQCLMCLLLLFLLFSHCAALQMKIFVSHFYFVIQRLFQRVKFLVLRNVSSWNRGPLFRNTHAAHTHTHNVKEQAGEKMLHFITASARSRAMAFNSRSKRILLP